MRVGTLRSNSSVPTRINSLCLPSPVFCLLKNVSPSPVRAFAHRGSRFVYHDGRGWFGVGGGLHRRLDGALAGRAG